LRFGSAVFWNTFLETYRPTGVAKRSDTDFICKYLLDPHPHDGPVNVSRSKVGGVAE